MMHPINTTNLSQKRLALIGNPNCGKSALFNRLTGSHQKVANYAGVTVEIKRGRMKTPEGQSITVVDLPGTYTLQAHSDDEKVTCEVITGHSLQEPRPDLIAVIIDATKLRRGLRLLAALKRSATPCVVVLNMMDKVNNSKNPPSAPVLSQVLQLPVVETYGNRADGARSLIDLLNQASTWARAPSPLTSSPPLDEEAQCQHDDQQAQQWMQEAGLDLTPQSDRFSMTLDRFLLNPWIGSAILLLWLFFIFQATFSWAEWPMTQIENATSALAQLLDRQLAEGFLKSLLIDGVLAGVGGVLVFLPQILILFFFILIFEESGYLPRAALLLDRLMSGIGLSGRSFIPLLSSFACAIPGVLATRTIENRRERWTTMAIAPLMTCSARLPVYALLIGAFIPAHDWGPFNLQGLVLLGLYLLSIVSAVIIAAFTQLWKSKEGRSQLMIELPDYHWPQAFDLLMGLQQRALLFLRNVGGIILALNILLWFLASFPQAPVGYTGSAIEYSFAGQIGRALAMIFEPIGFNWQISIALIPGLAAREVAVGALATVYALSQEGVETSLSALIAHDWSMATGLSLLIWYVYAPQCLATLAVIRKETGQWSFALLIAIYLFALAYLASFITYHLTLALL